MSPFSKTFPRSACAVLCLWASIGLIAGCGPKPGTPEHVLKRLEEGHVVGVENLQLLTIEHLDPMLALINNPGVDRIAKQQLMIRVTSLNLDRPLERLGSYLAHDEPDVRLHLAGWMATLNNPEVLDRLIEQLQKEPEQIVRIKIAGALATAQCRAHLDPAQTATRLIELLRAATPSRKQDYLFALSGYPTEDALKAIGEHLHHQIPAIAGGAGRAITIVANQDIDAVAHLIPAMVEHSYTGIHRNGLRILWGQVRRSDADACQTELPAGLKEHSGAIIQALDTLRANTALPDTEKKLADQIIACLKPATPDDPGQVQ